MNYQNNEIVYNEEIIFPKVIKEEKGIKESSNLLKEKKIIASFSTKYLTEFENKGSYIVLDFGKEIAGGIRIVSRIVKETAKLHLSFGESYSEAITKLKEKNTTNDHSPRDFVVTISNLSDLSFGQTGFRFVKIELEDENPIKVSSIVAVNKTQKFGFEGKIETNDEKLNKILETAAYTLKLCFQNGCIWDGVKRDRLVWSGDLHQEIVSSLYLFGNTPNIPNVLEILREDSEDGEWINGIPTYSAWWVINLIDYCRISGNDEFFTKHKDFAINIFRDLDSHTDNSGKMDFGNPEETMCFFLDWPTYRTNDAVIGTASLIYYAAKKFAQIVDCEYATSIISKLKKYISLFSSTKQTIAFQTIAGNNNFDDNRIFMEKNGASGFSTFMSYYILSALSICSSKKTVDIIKEYFGGMLSVGATTFFEDFDIEWLNNCNTLETLPTENQNDIHGDFGKYCYNNFRHSLCHGWSSGVLAFFVEYIIGLKVRNGFKEISVKPNIENLLFIHAKLPTPYGIISISIENGETIIEAPKEIKISND